MGTGDKKKKHAKTPEFRVSYPSLLEPRVNDLSGKNEYSVQAIFKKGENLAEIEKIVMAAIVAKWGADQKKWPKPLRLPFRDQADRSKTNDDGKEYLPDGYEAGAKYVNLKNERRPAVIDQNRNPITDPSEIYGGCYARAIVDAYAYDKKGNKGVALSLLAVQKTKDGYPFGSARINVEEEFEVIEGFGTGETSGESLFDNL